MANNIKPCPVSKELFEECCWKCALFMFEEDWEWRDKYEDQKELGFDMHPDMAAAFCELSIPTFKMRAKQFLWPEKYGELPEAFFNGKTKHKYKPMKENSYKDRNGSELYRQTRMMIDYQKAEQERLRVKGADELPKI